MCGVAVLAACAEGAHAPEATLAPQSTGDAPEPATLLRHGDGSRRSVALTFDLRDGAGDTAEILAALAAEGVRGAFAVTGLWAEAHPALMRAIAADGHRFLNDAGALPRLIAALRAQGYAFETVDDIRRPELSRKRAGD